MSKPFFSILIPVYNVEKYLALCLESVLRQSFTDYEIILVDDGSKDSSGRICDDYQAKYEDRIRVLHKANQGLISARREGLKLANGRYICFLDSDDCLLGESLTKLFSCISETKTDVVIFKWKRIDEDGNDLEQDGSGAFSEAGFVEKNILFEGMLQTTLINPLWSKCCKYELFDINADYSQYYAIPNGEDLLQSLPVIYKANTVYFLPEILYGYRLNSTSITHNYQKKQYQTLRYLRPLLYEYLEKMELDTKKNINTFFETYLNIIWDNLEAIFRAIPDRQQRSSILDEIRSYPFVNKARVHLPSSSINKIKWIGLNAFYSPSSTRLEWYMKLYLPLVDMLRKIHQ